MKQVPCTEILVTSIRQSTCSIWGDRREPIWNFCQDSICWNCLCSRVWGLLSTCRNMVPLKWRDGTNNGIAVWRRLYNFIHRVCQLWNPSRYLPSVFCRQLPCTNFIFRLIQGEIDTRTHTHTYWYYMYIHKCMHAVIKLWIVNRRVREKIAAK